METNNVVVVVDSHIQRIIVLATIETTVCINMEAVDISRDAELEVRSSCRTHAPRSSV